MGSFATGMIGLAGAIAGSAAAPGPPPLAQPVLGTVFLAIMDAEFRKRIATPSPPAAKSSNHCAAAAVDAAPVMAQADLNKDQVTLVEYRTAKLASFDRMDADKDGVVSVAEMKAAGLIK